jgi:hypothetical protein
MNVNSSLHASLVTILLFSANALAAAPATGPLLFMKSHQLQTGI